MSKSRALSPAAQPAQAQRPGAPPAAAGQAQGQAQGQPKRRSSTGMIVLFVMLLVPALALFLPTTVVFLLGMAPTLVAFVSDRDPQHYAAVTVGPLNFCGVLPLEMNLWRDGHTIDLAWAALADPFNWLLMYGLAGLGWLIYFSVPSVVAIFIAQRHQAEVQRLRERLDRLEEEWGEDVTGRAPLVPPG
ncbi:MAG: hypothetical protein H6843_03115 [Rhodospirillaceae bacterium]|nr:hypothetical protein [Rhodospirillaceae bacterium]